MMPDMYLHWYNQAFKQLFDWCVFNDHYAILLTLYNAQSWWNIMMAWYQETNFVDQKQADNANII